MKSDDYNERLFFARVKIYGGVARDCLRSGDQEGYDLYIGKLVESEGEDPSRLILALADSYKD